jgi:hypothetical protein
MTIIKRIALGTYTIDTTYEVEYLCCGARTTLTHRQVVTRMRKNNVRCRVCITEKARQARIAAKAISKTFNAMRKAEQKKSAKNPKPKSKIEKRVRHAAPAGRDYPPAPPPPSWPVPDQNLLRGYWHLRLGFRIK